MARDLEHDKLISIATALPGAVEDRPWGSVHCKVAGKIFVGWGRHDDGEMSVGFKTHKVLQSMLVASDPRFTVAAYVGKHGWVDMKPGKKPNWAEVEQFIEDSYRMIAPKRLVKELEARRAPAPEKPASKAAPKRAGRAELENAGPAKKPAPKTPPAGKPAAKKPAAKKRATNQPR